MTLLSNSVSNVNLVTYCDRNYLQHAAVMIHSLESVVSNSKRYRVFLLVSDCSAGLIDRAQIGFDRLPSNVIVEIIQVTRELPPSLKPKRPNITSAIFKKILIYEELPDDIDRVVFIDADIVLCRDPAELFKTNLGDNIIAAVREKLYLLPNCDSRRRKVLGLESYRDYFNSGVMVVDLQKWNDLYISRHALEFAQRTWGQTPYHDQDAFNAIIRGRWTSISPLWNPRGLNEVRMDDGSTKVMTNYEIYERNLQYLVHYSGPHKPWLFLPEHPEKQLYWDFLRKSGFSNYLAPDRNWANFARKYARRVKALVIPGRPFLQKYRD